MNPSPVEQIVYNPFDPSMRADPYPVYARLRAEEPVHESPFEITVLSRYADIAPLLRDPRMSSDARKADRVAWMQDPGVTDRLEKRSKTMLFSDAPDHTRLRGLVSKAFTARMVEALAPRVHELVDGLIGGFDEDEIDLISSFAYPLPVRIIGELLGVPEDDAGMFHAWSNDLARALDPLPSPEVAERIIAAVVSFDAYFARLIAARRAHPREDLLSALAHTEEHGDRLSEEEMLSMCRLLLVAGHETTMNLIGNGVHALLSSPGQADLVRAGVDPVEELLRYDSPVQLTGRVATEDIDVAGVRIPARRLCLLLVGSANRDEAHFPNASALDVTRTDTKHLSFSAGPHFCLGAPLARLEARIAIPELMRRFPHLARAGEEPAWRDTLTLRGLQSVLLKLH